MASLLKKQGSCHRIIIFPSPFFIFSNIDPSGSPQKPLAKQLLPAKCLIGSPQSLVTRCMRCLLVLNGLCRDFSMVPLDFVVKKVRVHHLVVWTAVCGPQIKMALCLLYFQRKLPRVLVKIWVM